MLVFLCGQSGEKEPLDLGLPISNLDGLRVVLELGDHVQGKGKMLFHTYRTDIIPTIQFDYFISKKII